MRFEVIESVSGNRPGPVLVTFVTPSYRDLLPAWVRGVQRTGLSYEVYGAPEQPSWRQATMLKPACLAQAMESLQTGLFWLDVDGEIVSPAFQEAIDQADRSGADIALCVLGLLNPPPRRPRRPRHHRDTARFAGTVTSWAAGAIYVPISSRGLIGTWALEARLAAEGSGRFADVESDQEILAFLCVEQQTAVFVLPESYCSTPQHPQGNPVISHGIASRRNGDRPPLGRRCLLPPAHVILP